MVKVATPRALSTQWVADSPTASEAPSFGTVHTPTSTGESMILRPRVASEPSFVSSTRGSAPVPAHDSL